MHIFNIAATYIQVIAALWFVVNDQRQLVTPLLNLLTLFSFLNNHIIFNDGTGHRRPLVRRHGRLYYDVGSLF